MASLNSIQRSGERGKMRVGRGGKRGKTAGRGTKGQNARAGNKKRPEYRDIIKKLPKRRGYGKNRGRTVVGSRPDSVAITLQRLERLFPQGGELTQRSFSDLKIGRGRGVFQAPVKVVSGGAVSQKFSLKGIASTASARAAIEAAGGTIA